MTAFLTDNLPLLAGAPNGIKKLRELILELAIRGKLVPQDPSDGPAIDLLDLLTTETGIATVRGKGKKQALPNIIESEQPFALPNGWLWGRLGDVAEVLDSLRRPVTKQDRKPGPYPYYGASGVVDHVSAYIFDEPLVLVGEDGAKWGVGDRTAFSISGKTWVNNHAHVLRPNRSAICDEYLVISLIAQDLSQFITGMTVPKLNQARLISICIALPPLAEQHRIVAKVDELMALCDRLEAQQSDAESAHTQLVQALLESLTQATDAADFASSWQRLSEHFHTLFTTESSIDALKQTLLQLAVMGKLVPQDITGREQDGIPAGWEAKNIDEFCTVQGGIQKTPLRRPISQHFPYLRVANVQRGKIDVGELERYELSLEELKKWRLNAGDLLIVEGNGSANEIGRCAVWRGQVADCVFQNHLMRVRPIIAEHVDYLALYLNSPIGTAHMRRLAITTSGLFNLSVGKIRSIPVALPPLAEQYRIVAKINQLMALCDQLKTRLNQARQVNEQLAGALVARTVANNDPQAPVVPDLKSARTLLAAEITDQLHDHRTFGQRKLQKVVYLAEHAARLGTIQGNYLRDAAGPHDRHLMNQIESELQDLQWYECIERETVGHAYRPLSKAGQHRQAYEKALSAAARATIEQVIALMRNWDTDRCEMTVTLYAAWNDLILEGRPVSDEAILAEVMHAWNVTKLRFSKAEWLAILDVMKQRKLLTPTGFGKRTTGGMLTLPGV